MVDIQGGPKSIIMLSLNSINTCQSCLILSSTSSVKEGL